MSFPPGGRDPLQLALQALYANCTRDGKQRATNRVGGLQLQLQLDGDWVYLTLNVKKAYLSSTDIARYAMLYGFPRDAKHDGQDLTGKFMLNLARGKGKDAEYEVTFRWRMAGGLQAA